MLHVTYFKINNRAKICQFSKTQLCAATRSVPRKFFGKGRGGVYSLIKFDWFQLKTNPLATSETEFAFERNHSRITEYIKKKPQCNEWPGEGYGLPSFSF